MRKIIASVYSGFISTSVITKIITFACVLVALYALITFRNLSFVLHTDSSSEQKVLDTSNLEWFLDDLYAYDGELNKEILRVHSEPFLNFASVEMVVLREKELIENIRNYFLEMGNEIGSSDLVLQRQSEAYINQLESKLNLVERYDDSLRSYRTAKKLVPLIKKQLLNAIRDRNIENDSSYQSLVGSIYSQVQRFVDSPDPQRKDNILLFIEKSAAKLNSITPVFENANEFVLKSTDLIESKTLNDELLRALFAVSMSSYREIKTTLNGLDNTSGSTIDFSVMSEAHSQLWVLAGLFMLFVLFICYFIGYAAKQTFLLSGGIFDKEDQLGVNDDHEKYEPAANANDVLREKPLNKETFKSSGSGKNQLDCTLESLAMTLSHQIQTPLQHVSDHVNGLCPILERVHKTFDQLEKDSSEGVDVPDSVMSLIHSSSIAEFPFAVFEIKKGMDSALMATDNIRQLSKRETVNKTRLDLNEAITHAVEMKSASLHSIANVKLKLASECPVISAVKIDIHHMLDCLIANAIESMNGERSALGKIEITTIIQDDVVKLLVRDDGVGIPKDALEKVYHPFFTTKKGEPGKGIGLTLVKRHVELYDGKIDLVSDQGSGTIVRISFPYDPKENDTGHDYIDL